MAESAGTLAEAFVRIRSDDSMARAGMSKFRGAFQGQMAGLQKMAVITLSVVGLGAGIRGIWNLSKSLVMAGDQIEMLRNSYSTMLRSKGIEDAAGQADVLIDRARKFAAVTPFTEESMGKAVTMFLPYAKGMDDLFEKVKNVGDVASVSVLGMQALPRITKAFTDMLGKGKIDAQDMRQLAEAGVPAWNMLAKSQGKTVAEVRKLSEAGKLAEGSIEAFISTMGSDFAGNMEKQSRTVTGLTTTIVDTVKVKAMQAMAPIRDLVQGSFSKIAAFVQSDEFAGVMERVKGIIASIAETIRAAFESPLAKAAMKFGAIALASGVVIGIFVAMKVALAAAFAMVAPFIPIMLAIGAAAAAIKAAWDAAMSSDKAEKIKQDLRDIWTNLKLIWENVKATFGNIASAISEAFGGAGTDMKDKIGGAVEWVTDKLNTLTTWFGVMSSNWDNTWDVMVLHVKVLLKELEKDLRDLLAVAVPGMGFTVDDQKALEALKTELHIKNKDMKAEFAARKKAMEERIKAEEAARKDGDGNWGDKEAGGDGSGEDVSGKSKSKSESVGIVALQKKMQDIFGGAGSGDPVVKAVEKGNTILAKISDKLDQKKAAAAKVDAAKPEKPKAADAKPEKPSRPEEFVETIEEVVWTTDKNGNETVEPVYPKPVEPKSAGPQAKTMQEQAYAAKAEELKPSAEEEAKAKAREELIKVNRDRAERISQARQDMNYRLRAFRSGDYDPKYPYSNARTTRKYVGKTPDQIRKEMFAASRERRGVQLPEQKTVEERKKTVEERKDERKELLEMRKLLVRQNKTADKQLAAIKENKPKGTDA